MFSYILDINKQYRLMLITKYIKNDFLKKRKLLYNWCFIVSSHGMRRSVILSKFVFYMVVESLHACSYTDRSQQDVEMSAECGND